MARKTEKAVEAMLTTSTIVAASEQSGVSVRTLFRWLQEPDFQDQLRQARHRAFNNALSRICGAAMEAADTLIKGVRGEKVTRTQYLSAKTLLEIAKAIQGDDLVSRVEGLEQRFLDQRTGLDKELEAMSLEQLEERLRRLREIDFEDLDAKRET
jgi:hypothetical protein